MYVVFSNNASYPLYVYKIDDMKIATNSMIRLLFKAPIQFEMTRLTLTNM